MRTFYKFSSFYAIVAIVGGVFYREFTKFNAFDGRTTLGFVHTHAFMLGMFFFLIVLLLEKQFQFSQHPRCKAFLYTYNAGVLMVITMLVVRGIPQVLHIPLSSGMDAAISGIAGIGHIILCVGLIFFFLILKGRISEEK